MTREHQNVDVSINVFDLIDSLCVDFRRDCKAGKKPRIEDYLHKIAEEARETLFRNLLPVDIRYRERSGEAPQPSDYLKPFPQFKRVIGDAFNFSTAESMEAMHSTPVGNSADLTATTDVPAANRIGDYQLIRELGRGGFGVVYEARENRSGNRVALKTLPTGVDGQEANADRLYRFRREFRSLSEINHPNLVGMQALEVDGKQWFFTMDLIDGTDFLSYVRPGGNLDESRLRESLKQVVTGVIALHQRRILHRDLKPSNVLISSDGQVSILDFGLVAELEQRSEQTASMQTQHFVGTPRYAAPEQVLGQRSPASDWYALGTMLFESLTGEAPYRGTATELLIKKREDDPPVLTGRDELPADLAELADRLLQRDPKQRPTSQELAETLQLDPDSTSHGSVDEEVDAGYSTTSDQRLIGRETQLAQLDSARRELLEKREPLVVWITGLSGEGKSSLAEKFLGPLRQSKEFLVLSGRCYDRESVPFKVIDTQIDSLVRFLRSCSDDETNELLPKDIEMLAHLFPVMRRVQPIADRAKRSVAGLAELHIRNLAFAALRDLLVNISRTTPIVMFVDDLQWGDGDSAEMLATLLAPPNAPAVLFLGSYRVDEADTSSFLQDWKTTTVARPDWKDSRTIEVAPLTAEQCMAYLAQRYGDLRDTDKRNARELFEKTRGNPYFIEQLTEGFDPETGAFDPLPLDQVITNRLARCPSEARDLLNAIAIAGKAVAVSELSAVTGHPSSALATITHMRSERLVRLVGSADEQLVDTYHDRVREATLRELDDAARHGLHRKFAENIEASASSAPSSPNSTPELDIEHLGPVLDRVFDVAHHYYQAGDQRAFKFLLQATKSALGAYASESALEHAKRALEMQPVDLDRHGRFQLQFMLAMCQAGCDMLDQAVASYHAALDLADTRLQRASCYDALGGIYWQQNENEKSIGQMRSAFSELREPLPKTLLGKSLKLLVALVKIHIVPTWIRTRVSQHSELELTKLSQMYRSLGNLVGFTDVYFLAYGAVQSCLIADRIENLRVKTEAYSLYGYTLAFAGVSWLDGRYIEKARRFDARLSESDRSPIFRGQYAIYVYIRGSLEKAVKLLSPLVEELERRGELSSASAIHHFLWHAWAIRGRASELIKHAKSEQDVAKKMNNHNFVSAYGLYGQAEGFARQGDTAQAHRLADAAIALLEPWNGSMVCLAYMQKARVQLQSAEYVGARASLSKSLKDLPKLHYLEVTAPAFPLQAEAVLAMNWPESEPPLNRRVLLKAHLAAFAARCAGLQFPNIKPHAYRVSGRLAAAKGRRKKASRLFDKAIAAAAKIGAEYEHARAIIDKSTLSHDCQAELERGLRALEGLGCVLPDAEVEYLEIDRKAHHARAAAARENM